MKNFLIYLSGTLALLCAIAYGIYDVKYNKEGDSIEEYTKEYIDSVLTEDSIYITHNYYNND